ncbi:MAG: methylenetetrahydrofolate dehydrogenase [Clostridiales bacterium]|nr:MAG: methylenetetrahydrofolate dehydrogenase [Clostridiales bacterium]
MKVKLPEHREFIIEMDENDPKYDECWDELQQIMKEYQKTGGSVYTPSFIEDNEDKVKVLKEKYGFNYKIEMRK